MRYLSDSVGTYHDNKDNLVEGRKYEQLDITDRGAVDALFQRIKPHRVFLAASNPRVDSCENLNTDKVNITGIGNVISNCENSQLIFFSSSYVFDGKSQIPYKPHEQTEPINRYGRQKESVEKIILGRGIPFLIIRTIGVFGQESKNKNFVSQVVQAVAENKKIHVPVDQTMNPIWAMDLAKISIHLSDRYAGEIFHVAGNQCLSKYEFAIKVAYKIGCKKPHDLVVAVKSEDMKQIAVRPLNGCLDCKSLELRAIGVPNLEKGLGKFLDS